MYCAALVAALSFGAVQAASTFSPARPPAIPLAVRSPYLNIWLNGDSGGNLPGSWPKFWTGEVTGWQGFVRVDGTTYNWMGQAPGPPTVQQVSFQYTSTKSIFTFDVAGKVNMTATFLSPVYPEDLVKQSLQFSYVDVRLRSADSRSHSVQVYMDISGEFTSRNLKGVLKWDTGKSNNVAYHQVALAEQAVFRETNEQADWGTWFLAASAGDGLTTKIGADKATREQFVSSGRLDNNKDADGRAVRDSWPVFALAKELGNVSADEKDVLFTIGLAQDQVINFQGASPSPVGLDGAWRKVHRTAVDSMASFHQDWSAALRAADALDNRIRTDAVAAAGEDYAAITALTVRQTFGALQVAQGPKQPYVFLKEISSNSDIQTVDVIFPAYPILLYLNATWGRLLLDPLYENQESGHYPNPFAIHDLGTFPNAVGHPKGDDEPMPLEECGNMIIATLAYAQRAGDNAYLNAHWPKLLQWAEFLVNDSLVPANQLSTDDFAGTLANQTNLALKGMIGLRAAAEIAARTGHGADSARLRATAEDYIRRWQELGINKAATPPHTTLSYNDRDSHGLLYNLYADRLLGLNLVPQSVYDMQSEFYKTIQLDFGVALDTRHPWTKSDWEMFAAAVSGRDTRDMFISKLRKWIDATGTGRPMTDLFDASSGGFPQGGGTFVARPVMGGVFALLALPR